VSDRESSSLVDQIEAVEWGEISGASRKVRGATYLENGTVEDDLS
jgi:hypothetical protein